MPRKIPKPVGNRSHVATSISITPELLVKAQLRAATLRRTFSNYVQVLMERDIHAKKAA